IEVKSSPGSGSVFAFTIDGGPRMGVPLVNNLTLEQLRITEDRATPATEETQLVGTVLLAEDGEDNRELIASHLRRAGLEVVIVTTGRLAVEAARAQKFSLVVMDMQMPELDGYGAARAMRESG